MGAAHGRLKNSKHKSRVKELIDLFHKKQEPFFNRVQPNTQIVKKWINENVDPRVKLRIDSFGKLPKKSKICECRADFLKYFEQFISSNHSLQFKDLQDVEFLGQVFEKFKFTCLLDNKTKLYGQVWITVKTAEIYQLELKQQYKGPSSFDVMWKAQHQKFLEWNTPSNRYKNAYVEEKKQKNNSAYHDEEKKKLQHAMGMYYQQRKQGTFGGTYWK